MGMTATASGVNDLHKAYCELSGMELQLRFDRERGWYEFTQAGFTKADLSAVIARLVRLIKEGERRPECLKWSNLIQSLDRFEEELAMIKSEEKGLKPVERPLTIFDLQRVLDCKIRCAEEMSMIHAKQDTFGIIWDNPQNNQRHKHLLAEIRDLRIRIAALA